MDIKELNKLARVCRRLGIKHLKTEEFELELSPDIQAKPVKTRKKLASPVNESLFNEPDAATQQKNALLDRITENDLLFWSASDGPQ
jgi:hypothetical protein